MSDRYSLSDSRYKEWVIKASLPLAHRANGVVQNFKRDGHPGGSSAPRGSPSAMSHSGPGIDPFKGLYSWASITWPKGSKGTLSVRQIYPLPSQKIRFSPSRNAQAVQENRQMCQWLQSIVINAKGKLGSIFLASIKSEREHTLPETETCTTVSLLFFSQTDTRLWQENLQSHEILRHKPYSGRKTHVGK